MHITCMKKSIIVTILEVIIHRTQLPNFGSTVGYTLQGSGC